MAQFITVPESPLVYITAPGFQIAFYITEEARLLVNVCTHANNLCVYKSWCTYYALICVKGAPSEWLGECGK